MKMTINPTNAEIEAARKILVNKVTQGFLLIPQAHIDALYALCSRVVMRAPKVKHRPTTPTKQS